MAPRRAADHPGIAVRRRLAPGASGVALTFDDCDDGAAWREILDVLARAGAPAAFFGLGMRVEQFPGTARRTVAGGHLAGAHGWDHADLTALPVEEVAWRLRADRDAWRRAGAAGVTVFRPPYGRYDATTLVAARRAGYRTMALWDVDPRDWESPDPALVVERVVGAATAGSVVDLHVTAATACALPGLIDGLRRRGLDCMRFDANL